MLLTRLIKHDVESVIVGVGEYEQVKKESVEIELDSGTCRVLSIDALIRAKEAMGSQKDIQTAVELRAIRERMGDEQ